MRLGWFVPLLSILAVGTVALADEGHAIPAPPDRAAKPSPDGRATDDSPPTEGLNGKLVWVGKSLFLKMPVGNTKFGKRVQLFTSVESVREKLTALANSPEQNIEIEGWPVEGKDGAFNVKEVSRDDGNYDGFYLINFDSGTLQGAAGKAMIERINGLPDIKFKYHVRGEDYLSIQSDYSFAQLRRFFGDDKRKEITNHIESMKRDPIKEARGD